MEIGHNVMHGQYDWMRDPGMIFGRGSGTTSARRRSGSTPHNYMHHQWTNVVGKDSDIGYGILRVDEDKPWHRWNLGSPVSFLAWCCLRVGRR